METNIFKVFRRKTITGLGRDFKSSDKFILDKILQIVSH